MGMIVDYTGTFERLWRRIQKAGLPDRPECHGENEYIRGGNGGSEEISTRISF